MRLSDESLRRFMRLYTEFYGEELTVNDARAMASRVLFLYEHLARPLPDGNNEITEPSALDGPPSSPPVDGYTESSPETRDRQREFECS